ncbi:hypothetical protein PsYK624_063710 [Phanerochaete sordida]|uniref:Uncharacterized protein n=1 Tax=Phanerochaete sordida TaxID=48140 RepID=A0A9P3G8Y1_9APHY|nr:hypothetical protein PsYK624_063710 [Phanerochaete sordida]
MSRSQDIKPRFDFVPRPVARQAAASAHPKPSTTKSTPKQGDNNVIFTPFSPPATSSDAWSYRQTTQAEYEARWGTHDPRHTRHAIAQLRELVNFGHFRTGPLRLTDDELRVLDVLEACLTGDGYWATRGEPRPRIHARPRAPVPEALAVQEERECPVATVQQARREGRTLHYRKTWGTVGVRPAVELVAELRAEVPGKDRGPHDVVDAVHAFVDYACSAAFAAQYGALDAFEHGTLCVLRRHVVWWEHEVQRKGLEKPEEKGKLGAAAVYPTRDWTSGHNTTVVLPRRKVGM